MPKLYITKLKYVWSSILIIKVSSVFDQVAVVWGCKQEECLEKGTITGFDEDGCWRTSALEGTGDAFGQSYSWAAWVQAGGPFYKAQEARSALAHRGARLKSALDPADAQGYSR